MAQSKPSVILVAGMCSVSTVVYEPLISSLRALGFTNVEAVNLASVDTIVNRSSVKPTAFDADVAAIRSTLQKHINEGHDVLIVGHSYGGTPSLCASEGLWKGQSGNRGVVRACLLSSSISLPGQSVMSIRNEWGEKNPGKLPDDSGAKVDMIDDETYVQPEGLQYVWFVDLPPSEMNKWGATLRPAAITNVTTPVPGTVTPSNWEISYLITAEHDPAMPKEFQKFLIEQAKGAGAKIHDVKEIESGHFVQITHSEEVAQWIAAQCESV